MNDETQLADARRLEKEEIEDLGTVTLARGEHVIHCLTVIGQIEGHSEAPQGQKTTKYEHVIPQLVAAQEDPRIEGLLVLLDAIYNRVIQNRKAGKYNHVYIDEIYLFFANGSGSGRSINNYSGEFLYKCWKRFRKYGAMLTGITQNVEECLLSSTARMMFANSEFLLMLNQATTDREQLARLLGASDTQMSYVDNAPAGHGLIKVGGAIVPFANELPKNTELYRLMSTKPGED